MSSFPEIRFKGRKYLLIKGAIATKKQYESGKPSYAHLHDNGIISRFGNDIGTKKDIVYTGRQIKVQPTMVGMLNMFDAMFGEGWK